MLDMILAGATAFLALAILAIAQGQSKLRSELETVQAQLRNLLDVGANLAPPPEPDSQWTFVMKGKHGAQHTIKVEAASENEAVLELVKRGMDTGRVVSITAPGIVRPVKTGP